MTEDEARDKWCPIRAIAVCSYLNTKDKTTQAVLEGQGCVASDCMMWRWDDPTSLVQDPESTGHCGLAGIIE